MYTETVIEWIKFALFMGRMVGIVRVVKKERGWRNRELDILRNNPLLCLSLIPPERPGSISTWHVYHLPVLFVVK